MRRVPSFSSVAGFVLAGCLAFLWGSNPVHGVLSLVGVSLAFAGVLLGEGLDFPALVVVLVYVGAVTVLFIFVVMLLNVRNEVPPYLLSGGVLLWLGTGALLSLAPAPPGLVAPVVVPLEGTPNLETFGVLLYGTERIWGVLLVGLVLFVAMVAAICLGLVSGENYRTQEFYTQIRRPNSVFLLRRIGWLSFFPDGSPSLFEILHFLILTSTLALLWWIFVFHAPRDRWTCFLVLFLIYLIVWPYLLWWCLAGRY